MKSRPKYWRSLAELEGDSEFQDYVEREFRSPTEHKALSSSGRRRFVQLMGASFALSGCRWPEEKILPHTSRKDGAIPGVPRHFATMMDLSGVATGLLVKSYDGRPIKVEGNPGDSLTKGGTSTFQQGAILGLYDPDRSSQVLSGKAVSSWKKYSTALADAFSAAEARGGAGLAILSRASSSPALVALRDSLSKKLPEAKWVAYEATDCAGLREGGKLAFGQDVRVLLHPEKADILVGLDSDLLSPAAPGGIGYSRAVASRRDPDRGKMSRIYAFEASVTELGSLADHRVSVRPSQVLAIAAYIDAKVSEALGVSGAQSAPSLEALGSEEVQKVLDVAVKDLLAHRGKGLLTVGARHGAEAHALCHRINVALGNNALSGTVGYVEPADSLVGGVDELAGLVALMEGGKVDSLLILGANPTYDAPADIDFGAALAKVKNTFHLGLYVDETARLCAWHAPEAHFLESWGDGRALDGTVRLAQPLIDPLLGGKSALEVVARALGEGETDPQKIVRELHGLGDEKAFKQAVHDGFTGAGSTRIQPALRSLSPVSLPQPDGLEIVFEADPAIYDGRFANNAWLQELPHPLSKMCWGNAALVSPVTAKQSGITDGHLCSVTVDGRSLSLPALITPGQADGVIFLSLGYGRTEAGVVGGKKGTDAGPVGSDTYSVRPAKMPHLATGGSIRMTGPRQDLAITQDLWAIDAVGQDGRSEREDVLVRETTLESYKEHPEGIKHAVHHPPLLNLWQPPISYDGQKWGMAVDLNKCTGCSACIVACQSENNTAVVGKSEVAMGREMTWIRVERYYKGDAKKAAVRQQPVMCQQCENAPCEQVCPVGATMHSPEGLNDMVYNRCIGTRYCSNNCPYKVRRFNYRNYNLETIGITPYTPTDDPRAKLKAMAFNPDVTVRSRGVMEKCTFCVQRIQDVKITQKNKKEAIADGSIKTACEQACPSGAIVFGDLNDHKSRVHAAQKVHRAYELLQELNNRPRVNYLARISNPHPELATTDGHSDHH